MHGTGASPLTSSKSRIYPITEAMSSLNPEASISRDTPFVNGEIRLEGEVDYYSINADAEDIIFISLESDTGLYPTLSIINNGEDILSTSNGYGSDFHNLKAFVFPNSEGPFFLRVNSQSVARTGKYTILSSVAS